MRIRDLVSSLFFFFLGVLFLIGSFNYSIWDRYGPGPGFAATAQLNPLFPNVISMEALWYQLEADILKEGPKISNGYIRLAELPGLGKVIDENVVHKYRVKEFPRK